MKVKIPFDLEKLKQWLSAFAEKLPASEKWLPTVKKRLPLILGAVLCFILVIVLVCCTAGNNADNEAIVCTVSVDNLEVHKKANDSSKVLGQLPMGLEVNILEQKTVKEINWGRIDKMTLADGTKIKAGWIDLQCVRQPGDPEPVPDATEPLTDPQPEVPSVTVNMGTVTAGKLNIRKGPDSEYETNGAYYNGDRIEILETQTVDNTVWGRTNLGWIGMGYVRMDGTAGIEDAAGGLKIVSNGNSTVLGYGVVNLGELNVRLGPGTDYEKIGTVVQGVRYAYYQVSSTTENWVRIENGWVSTEYFYLEGTTAGNAMTATVTTEELNIRTGPDTSFQNTGVFTQGEEIEILAQVGGWGYTEKGWVFVSYVEPVEPTYTTGPVKVTRGLNIRQEPNADSEKVGELVEGNVVTILEVQGNWGKVVQGWINLKYVEYESVG